MEKKLRKKFVYFSVGIIFIVLFSIVSFINFSNFFKYTESSNIVLDILAKNDGELPKNIDKSEMDFLNTKLSAEMTFSNRFFTVKTDIQKNIITVNTGDVYLTSSMEAVEYAKKVLQIGNESGFLGNFKYKVEEKDYGILVVFVDLTRDLDNFYSTLRNSLTVSVIVLLLVAIISFFMSKKAVSPMVQAYEKQKSFITDASHELKTPLTIINTSADVIEMESGSSKWTDNIHKQVIRLNELIGNLISLTKLEEEDKIERFDFSFSDVLEDVCNDYIPIALSKNKSLNLDIQKNISFNGDEKLIRQFIAILLDNSVKYAKEETEIKINLKRQNRKIIFTVENEAEDLKIKKYDEFFERFYRSDSSRNSKTGGYGVGLSIAQSIALKHKTKISAESFDGNTIIFTTKF